ncbi:PREDICTED: high mobility group B protein 15-like isoform X2 [Brassica oleracea var. oleracea]|uniref:high mobility group B protein 15-like isoform X2 n=1 Tax=Brassica oleracea var. oleracea TaxID=109376 RepID=UPI0006A6C1D3|nr:PREDICTED: high mobility group B protein 15-like isoform X2 [Brassica oleracea var. oleracea]
MVSKGMAASSSCLKQGSVPMDNIRITPEATYEAVVADPKLFMGSLERLHSQLSTKFMVPIIGGRDLDLHKLFVEVTSRGGINKILHERRWKEVTATFVFPPTATNASYVLRKYYFSLLNNYEQIYFFRSNSHIPPDSLHTPSGAPGLMQGGAMRPPQELQGVLNGADVFGVVDGKFEDGYLVTVTMGSEQLKGVLYQLVPENTVAAHQSHLGGFTNAWNNNGPYPQGVVTGGVTKRRRRRKKSEIKRRDPAHPKPNRSGYNFFFAEQHARLKPLHPGKDREISRMIGELWNKLNEQERLVYQGKAMEDKERYRTEMEDYRERLRTGQLISNAVPLQQRLPEQNVEIAEADLPIEEEEEEEDEEGDSSGVSGESEPHSDAEMEEPSLAPSGVNLNPNPSEMVVATKEKASDVVVMETSPVKKDEEPAVVVAAQQN